MLSARLSVSSRLSAVKFWGVERDMQIFNCVEFSARNSRLLKAQLYFLKRDENILCIQQPVSKHHRQLLFIIGRNWKLETTQMSIN